MDLSYEQFKSPTNKSSSLKLDLSYEAFKNPPEKKPGFWSELGTDVWKAIKEPFLSAPAKQVGEIPTLTTVEGGKEALQAGVDVLSSAIQDSANRNIKAIEGWTDPNTGKLQEAVNIGSAGVGILNALFAGMTAPIKVATKLPTVENIAKSAESFFGAIGVTGGKISKKSIDVLPISDEAKEIITPLAEEIGALAAQIVAGKYTGNMLESKKSELATKSAQVEHIINDNKIDPHFDSTPPGGKTSVGITESQKPPIETEAINKQEPVTTPTVSGVSPAGEVVKTDVMQKSSLAETTKTEAQAVGMKVDFEDMPGYSQRNQTTAAKLADDFVSNSPDNAKAVLEGNMNPPDGLLVGDVYSAIKRTYLKTGDVTGIMGLIRSKANDVATYFGQQVKAFDSGIRITDPVAAIKIISESRAKNKGIKNVESIVAKESSSIKESVKKSLRDNRTWEDFVNQIKC